MLWPFQPWKPPEVALQAIHVIASRLGWSKHGTGECVSDRPDWFRVWVRCTVVQTLSTRSTPFSSQTLAACMARALLGETVYLFLNWFYPGSFSAKA